MLEPIDFSKSYAAAEERGARPTGAADLLLWLGLTVLLTGTVISFVGLGEKGFRTSQLRLLGPIMSGTGLAVVIIRIALCCVTKRAKAAVTNFNLKDQLAKAVRIQHVVAVKAVQYQPVHEQSGIPSIHVDPSKRLKQNIKSVSFKNVTPLFCCSRRFGSKSGDRRTGAAARRGRRGRATHRFNMHSHHRE